jgi:predicted glycoside hydrolase/deacetylase ChbG (UPF0249 family)
LESAVLLFVELVEHAIDRDEIQAAFTAQSQQFVEVPEIQLCFLLPV